LHAKDLQPDFVDAIPVFVYVSAGKVPIAAPGGVVFKDLAHIGISKHGAHFSPASPSGQGAGVSVKPIRAPALAHTSSLDIDLTRNTRAPHFTPQHWLLCHMGLY